MKAVPEAIAETIENNMRKVIVDEQPINPKYCEKMSELLDVLIAQRREEAISYARVSGASKEAGRRDYQARRNPGFPVPSKC